MPQSSTSKTHGALGAHNFGHAHAEHTPGVFIWLGWGDPKHPATVARNPPSANCKGSGLVPYPAGMSPATSADIRPPLSRRQAAAFLGLKAATLAKWATVPGKGPRYSRSANQRGHVWYRVEDLERYLEQRAVGS